MAAHRACEEHSSGEVQARHARIEAELQAARTELRAETMRCGALKKKLQHELRQKCKRIVSDYDQTFKQLKACKEQECSQMLEAGKMKLEGELGLRFRGLRKTHAPIPPIRVSGPLRLEAHESAA